MLQSLLHVFDVHRDTDQTRLDLGRDRSAMDLYWFECRSGQPGSSATRAMIAASRRREDQPAVLSPTPPGPDRTGAASPPQPRPFFCFLLSLGASGEQRPALFRLCRGAQSTRCWRERRRRGRVRAEPRERYRPTLTPRCCAACPSPKGREEEVRTGYPAGTRWAASAPPRRAPRATASGRSRSVSARCRRPSPSSAPRRR